MHEFETFYSVAKFISVDITVLRVSPLAICATVVHSLKNITVIKIATIDFNE
jgi:hypothetical protein